MAVSNITGDVRRPGNFPWPPASLWFPALLVALLVLLPVFYLIVRTLGAGGEIESLLFRRRTLDILTRTLLLVFGVTGLSLAIALPLAWLTTRTDLPFRRIWMVLTAVPLVLPSYVAGFIVIAALGPRGMLQQVLAGPFGVERLPEIYGFPGSLLTITLVSYPYILLPLQATMRGLDPCLEEASHILGYGPGHTFRRVTLPLLRPAIASGALLVALYTLHDFGAVSLMRYETFTWAIYLQYQTSFDRMAAAALSMVLLVIAVIMLYIEFATRGQYIVHRSTAGVTRPPQPVKLGSWRLPALFFCSMVVLVSLVMPLSVLGYWLWLGISRGISLDLLWTSTLNSGYVSILAALAITVAALPVAILAVRYPGKLTYLLERSTYIGFALPGIVIALALVFFGSNYVPFIYQTLGLLIFAYAILFLPQAVGAIRSSLLQVSPSLEEAARILGRSHLKMVLSVTLPLVRPGILAGAGLVFLTTVKELPATLLLSPIGFKTLAISIWSATSEASFARASVPSLLLIILSSLPMAFFVLRGQR